MRSTVAIVRTTCSGVRPACCRRRRASIGGACCRSRGDRRRGTFRQPSASFTSKARDSRWLNMIVLRCGGALGCNTAYCVAARCTVMKRVALCRNTVHCVATRCALLPHGAPRSLPARFPTGFRNKLAGPGPAAWCRSDESHCGRRRGGAHARAAGGEHTQSRRAFAATGSAAQRPF
jgi:hypothetical protein